MAEDRVAAFAPRATRPDHGRFVYVRCCCGTKCKGTHFGWHLGTKKGDAWAAFRRHWERVHGTYPVGPA